jgi:hypothetical protein
LKCNLDHMFIMEFSEIQNALAAILGLRAIMKHRRSHHLPPPEPASSEEALRFVRELQRLPKPDREFPDEAVLAKYLDQFPLGTLRSVARRVMMDIMKRPAPKDSLIRTKKKPPRPSRSGSVRKARKAKKKAR